MVQRGRMNFNNKREKSRICSAEKVGTRINREKSEDFCIVLMQIKELLFDELIVDRLLCL